MWKKAVETETHMFCFFKEAGGGRGRKNVKAHTQSKVRLRINFRPSYIDRMKFMPAVSFLLKQAGDTSKSKIHNNVTR